MQRSLIVLHTPNHKSTPASRSIGLPESAVEPQLRRSARSQPSDSAAMAGPAAPNASIGSAILAQVQHAASSSKEVGASSPTGRPAQRGKAPEVNGRSKSKKKGKAKAAAGGEQSKQHSSANGKPRQEPDGVDAGSPSRREVLLQEIKALGGTEEDLDLVGSGSDDGSEEGITRIDGADAPHDVRPEAGTLCAPHRLTPARSQSS